MFSVQMVHLTKKMLLQAWSKHLTSTIWLLSKQVTQDISTKYACAIFYSCFEMEYLMQLIIVISHVAYVTRVKDQKRKR